MTKEPSIRVGLPVYGSVPVRTLVSLLDIADIGTWTIVEGTWIDKARNKIMREFEEDLLLMVDADMVFKRRDVSRLLNAIRAHPECGAISGHYLTRKGTGMPVCDWRHPTEDGWLSDEARRKKAQRHTNDKDLIYVDSFGGGFLAITQEAKRKLGSPWFQTSYLESGNYQGEDTFFCNRLQEAGFKPAVHFGLPIGHNGDAVYMPEVGKE